MSSLQEFEQFIAPWNLRYFKASEFYYKGASHSNPGSSGYNLNTDPPKALWSDLRLLAAVLDEVRDRINSPIILTSIYRSKPYNTAIGGAAGSRHMEFDAADFRSPGASVSQLAAIARDIRNSGRFQGGIGVYDTFLHVDTRGENKDWLDS